jgi:hypothetical protein
VRILRLSLKEEEKLKLFKKWRKQTKKVELERKAEIKAKRVRKRLLEKRVSPQKRKIIKRAKIRKKILIKKRGKEILVEREGFKRRKNKLKS